MAEDTHGAADSTDERVDAYVARVSDALEGVPRRAAADAAAELRSHITEELAAGAPIEGVLTSLGDPERYARELRDALSGPVESPEPQGRVLGMPYDFRGASVRRVGERIWNPADSRVFVPRLFGVGWTVNFGAVAVKLGLIRPDEADEETFASAPGWSVAAVTAVPAVLAAATLMVLVASWGRLPAVLPVHWGLAGRPDGWAPKVPVVGMLFAVGVLPVVATYALLLGRDAGKRALVLSASLLSLFAAVGLGLAAATVAGARGASSAHWIWGSIVAGLVLAFATLVVPARASLRAEWRRSLGRG